MRIDRPIGVWLLLLPGLWGITLGTQGLFLTQWSAISSMILFALGAVIMRGAGCVVNDLWDRDLDKQVERTRGRPLASGAVSVKQATIFLATLLLIGFFILIQFNIITLFLGILSLPLIIAYPLMKRITWWPQAFLGITFNFGVLMGYTAMAGTLHLGIALIFLGAMCWTIGYDTIYAHQDKEDDIMAGIKSTALIFGERSKVWISVFYAAAFTLIFIGVLLLRGVDITLPILCIPVLHFIWQIKKWEPDNQSSSLAIFKSNKRTGILFWLAFAVIQLTAI